MSIIDKLKPEYEIVDKAETLRYLEHGWPTTLCRWHVGRARAQPREESNGDCESRQHLSIGAHIEE